MSVLQSGPNPPFPHGLMEVSFVTTLGGGLGISHLGPIPPFWHGGKYSFGVVVRGGGGRVTGRVVVWRIIGWVGLTVVLIVVRIVGLVGSSQFGPRRVHS